MKIGEKELEMLANIIVRRLQEEFDAKHLSGNLVNTITVTNIGGEIQINIPAQTYNMLLFQQKGVVVHTSNGSYASKLDEEGSSFMVYPQGTRKGSYRISPRNHKGYINKILELSIQEWRGTIKGETKVEG